MSKEAGSTPVNPEPEKPAVVDREALAEILERESARVFEYCRVLVGREDVAANVTEAALSSARSMLQDPDRLRVWLADLARRQALARNVSEGGSPEFTAPADAILRPDSREVVELVYRHGIHPEDLGAVLGVPADEASALLAAAELELDRREPLAEPDPAEESLGPVEPEADRLRAWLFALARREALAVAAIGTAGRAAAGAELARYPPGEMTAANLADAFPPASWWRGSVAQRPPRRRRVRLAVLTAVPLAAVIGVAVYLGGMSRPVGSRVGTGTGGTAIGSAGLPGLVLPDASPAVPAPHASPSPAVPVSALFPASPAPGVQPLPTSPPVTSPSPTPKPSPTTSPKPSPKPSPTPSPKPSPKPSPTPSPKPSPSPTKKSSASPTPKSTPKSTATPKPTSG